MGIVHRHGEGAVEQPPEEVAADAEYRTRVQAREEAKAAAEAAKMARFQQALRDTPADINSIPSLRAELDEVKKTLREVLGVPPSGNGTP